ncbi:MAG: Na-translocating system protein MpsC family protein [Planctomycetota bacterium]
MAQQIAQAAIAFEQQRTGHVPKSATVVLNDDTLVITLREALSPAEKTLAESPAGAAQVQEFHRQLFATASDSLRQEIKRITGVEVREAAAEVEPTTGTVVKVFTSGTVVQVFLLADSVGMETWSDTDPAGSG